MSPTAHIIISAGAGAVIAHWLQSPAAGLACFVGGVLIDVDHQLDCYIGRKKFPWTIDEIMDFYHPRQKGKLHILFHSYELFVLLWFITYYFGLGGIWLGLLSGATLHLICDQVYNPLKPLAYFFTFRLLSGFEKKKLYRDDYYEKHATLSF